MARKSLILALEDMEECFPVSDESLIESQAAVDETTAVINDDLSEIKDETVAIEEAVEDIGTLEDIKSTMEDSIDNGGTGIDETAAQIAEVTVEAICSRLGFTSNYRPIPATESFGTVTRREQTEIAIEGLGETINKAWSAVISATDRIATKVGVFLSTLTKNTKVIIKHLEDLKSKVQSTDESLVKGSEELTTKSLGLAFSDGGESNFKTAMDIISRTNTLIANTKNLVKDVLSLSKELDAVASSDKADDKTLKDVNSKLVTAIHSKYGKISKVADKINVKMSQEFEQDNSKAEGFGPFVDHSGLFFLYQHGIMQYVFLFPKAFEEGVAESATALDKLQMLKVIDSTLSLLKTVEEFASSQNDVKAVFESLKKAAVSASKALSSSDDALLKSSLRTLSSDIQMFNGFMKIMGTLIPNLGILTGKAVGNYVSASLSNLKEPKSA